MAVFPKKYSPPMTSDIERKIAALEEHIRYMESQMEFYAEINNKKINNLNQKVEEGIKNVDI